MSGKNIIFWSRRGSNIQHLHTNNKEMVLKPCEVPFQQNLVSNFFLRYMYAEGSTLLYKQIGRINA
jgi:hypothetical protein